MLTASTISLHSARVFCRHDQPNGKYHFWPRQEIFQSTWALKTGPNNLFFLTELTDAIAKDWGGKPFVDMINGWKQALKAHPEVLITLLYI